MYVYVEECKISMVFECGVLIETLLNGKLKC